ncbi:unnamed protein product [Cutaneotrichosporon oleaginosum]
MATATPPPTPAASTPKYGAAGTSYSFPSYLGQPISPSFARALPRSDCLTPPVRPSCPHQGLNGMPSASVQFASMFPPSLFDALRSQEHRSLSPLPAGTSQSSPPRSPASVPRTPRAPHAQLTPELGQPAQPPSPPTPAYAPSRTPPLGTLKLASRATGVSVDESISQVLAKNTRAMYRVQRAATARAATSLRESGLQ